MHQMHVSSLSHGSGPLHPMHSIHPQGVEGINMPAIRQRYSTKQKQIHELPFSHVRYTVIVWQVIFIPFSFPINPILKFFKVQVYFITLLTKTNSAKS